MRHLAGCESNCALNQGRETGVDQKGLALKKRELSRRNRRSWLIALGLSLGMSFPTALPVRGANLSVSAPIKLATLSGSFDISVYPGSAGYTSTVESVGGVFGDGEVLDYRFFNGVDGAAGTNGYAAGTGLRVFAPRIYDKDIGSHSDADVWTTNDPETDFSGTADYTANTLLSGSGVIGEIDISGMSAGTLYVIGGYTYPSGSGDISVSITLSGEGQPDIGTNRVDSLPKGAHLWTFWFDAAESYNKLTYNFGGWGGGSTQPSMPYPSRGMFMGLILDGELIPQGAVLTVR